MRDDLKAAFRSLRQSPTFTAVALTVIALGIGAGTAIFSIVDAVVLRALPFDEHDRLAVVLEHDPTRPTTFGSGSTTVQMFLDWRRMQDSFDGVAYVGSSSYRVQNVGGDPADARGQRVTWEFFPLLRVQPLLGRAFSAADEIDGQHRVAILSYGFWQRYFGGAPDVIGKTLRLSDESWQVVGVMPQGFEYPVASDRPTEIYAPLRLRNEDKVRGGSRNYNGITIARLRNGVSRQQAQEQMSRVMVALDQQYPKWSPQRQARVVPLHEHLVGRVRSWMLMLLGAVTLVLLIACANVANLMLARATVRGREMGIRAALGAGRWRLIRGLLVEGLVLSTVGAVIGVMLAYAGVQVMRAWLPAGIPRVAAIGIDLRVLLSAIAAATVSGIFFGIVPALHSSRPDLTRALKDSGRSATAGVGTQRLRGALVIAEVALAVLLLVGAGLFVGSFIRLMRIDLGFDYRNVLVLNINPSGSLARLSFDQIGEQTRTMVPQILDAVRRVPGVDGVATVTNGTPLTGSWSRNTISLPGRGELDDDADSLDSRIVTPDYLRVMRIPLVRGRYVDASDSATSAPVIVINETAARRYWPGEDALGKTLKLNDKERTVVGIMADIRHLGPEAAPRQEGHTPITQNSAFGATLVVRTTGKPLDALRSVKAAIWSVDKNQRLTSDTVTLEAYMDRLIAQRRFNMAVLALFGALGLVIAAVGIYGVMAYLVAQRTSEIGVRMALGATRSHVVVMVLKRASVLIVAGLMIGCGAAWYLTVTPHIGLKDYLFKTEPTDIAIFAAALVLLAAAGFIASAVPARRAASVDPLVALRHE